MGYALKKEFLPNYTYADYLKWEGNWELIDGIPYAMSPSPSFKHQRINGKIFRQFDSLLDKCSNCEAILPFDWKVDEKTVVQPDISVICKPVKNQNYLDFAPTVVFEILSPATSLKDRNVKFEIYKSAGVKYYVIIDPIKETAEIFELFRKNYKLLLKTKDKKLLFKLVGCDINFDFSKIWE